jgi:RNA polymerase sigma factor (sigma-70 family)
MADFDQIVAKLGPALLRVAASYERNPAPRQDLFQEMLLAIAQSLPRLREETRLRAFVFRIAHNKGVDHVARHASAPATEEIPERLALPGGSPEEGLMARQRTERLAAAVRSLDLPYRQVITLLLEDLSYVEIADALGITVSNVGVRVNRAKAQLRNLLDHG